MRGFVELIENLGELAMMVLHTMTLVNDHVLPLDLCGKGEGGGGVRHRENGLL